MRKLMNRLRDLAVDGALLALPLGAVAYLLHKVIGLLSELLAPIAPRFFRRAACWESRRSTSRQSLCSWSRWSFSARSPARPWGGASRRRSRRWS